MFSFIAILTAGAIGYFLGLSLGWAGLVIAIPLAFLLGSLGALLDIKLLR